MKQFLITGLILLVSEAGADSTLHASADVVRVRRAAAQHGQL